MRQKTSKEEFARLVREHAAVVIDFAQRLLADRAEAECVDTAGVSHRLSEYIGRGDYVVLQFWEEQTWEAQ